MASRKLIVNNTCPFCGCLVYYTRYGLGTEFVQSKRGTKQYFHRECYMKHVEGQRKLREEKACT